MPEKNVKTFIYPIVALAIFTLLVFGAGYAYFAGSTSLNTANYQVSLPKTTSLVCTKTDCGVTLTPQMMYNTNVNATVAKGTSTCYLNCTCTGTQNAVCSYNVKLLEMGTVYTPSSGLSSSKEFTAKVTSPSGCSAQNSSSTETQVNTIRDKVVSSCSLTVPASGTVSANVAAEFKWYNLNLDQSAHANRQYTYQLTNDNQQYTVTFDPNGGSVGTTSKQVTYGETYGTLPTPTWSGHTFRGWNGKNKFNKDASALAGIKNETEFGSYGSNVLTNPNLIKAIKPSTAYHISYNVLVTSVPDHDTDNGAVMGFRIYSGVSGYSTITLSNSIYYPQGQFIKFDKNFTTPDTLHDSEAAYRLIIYTNRYKNNGTNVFTKVKVTDVQIEEGTERTVYEPYYVTETTKVTQTQNHTLTAIWD